MRLSGGSKIKITGVQTSPGIKFRSIRSDAGITITHDTSSDQYCMEINSQISIGQVSEMVFQSDMQKL